MPQLPAKHLRTLDDLPLAGRTVFVRADFNVTLGSDGTVDENEDYRIEAALPTLKELMERGCKVVVATHFGRPPAGAALAGPAWDLEPIRQRLTALLGSDVPQAEALVGRETAAAVQALTAGQVLLLPNVRLDAREEAGDEDLAKALAALADAYVNEAFSVSHRRHASVAMVPQLLPSCAGRRTAHEVAALERLRHSVPGPYVAIISGAKIATKVGLLRELLQQADEIYLGGQIANLFLHMAGNYQGGGFSADDIALAGELWSAGQSRLRLPVDVVAGPIEPAGAVAPAVAADAIPADAEGVWDVGPRTVEAMAGAVARASTVLWNGPLGRCEVAPYDAATVALAQALAQAKAWRVVGGGDTVNILEREGLMSRYDHVSVGGGALVAFLENAPMPGLAPLYG